MSSTDPATESRRYLNVYWGAVALYLVLVAWWVFFFARQDDILVRRIQESGGTLNTVQIEAVRDATRTTMRMFVFEGSFMGLVLMASVYLVLRSQSREVELMRRQRNFLSAVTHELRSPIASAKLYVESLALGRVPESKRERYLTHAGEDLERLRVHVDEILETARLTTTGPELSTEPLEMRSFVERQIEKVEREESGVRIEATLEDEIWIEGDGHALESIVRNLIGNACKYGGPEPRIEVRLAREGTHVVFEVRDHGPGLGDASPTAIFEAFVRGGDENVRQQPGVGLGLYLTAQYVKALHGTIRVQDGLDGGGTSFRVQLPSSEGPPA